MSNEKCLGQSIPVDEECIEKPCKPGRRLSDKMCSIVVIVDNLVFL